MKYLLYIFDSAMKGLIVIVVTFCWISSSPVFGTPATFSDYIDTIDIGSEEDPQPVGAADAKARLATCGLPALRGYCRALFVRWRFDPQAKRCVEFRFGGCGGNANNFLTKQDCYEYCDGTTNQ